MDNPEDKLKFAAFGTTRPNSGAGMGNSQKLSPSDQIIRERGEDYGDAWKLVDAILRYISCADTKTREGLQLFMYRGLGFHNWMLIPSKMMRIIHSPDKADHWLDNAGYATLVHN
jgi:hypothetical protein